MEIRPNFGGGSPGFIRGGVSFFLQGGVPDFPKQGGLYPSDPPRCTPMTSTHNQNSTFKSNINCKNSYQNPKKNTEVENCNA